MENNKNIVNVIWTTSNHLVACGDIKNALKCLLMLVGGSPTTDTISSNNKNNSNQNSSNKKVQMNNIDESITRIRIAELLLQYTTNHDEARFHLEKSVFLLDSDSTDHSLELLCKISSFLIDYFYSGNALNLSKQWLKKGIKYSISLKNNHWLLYFLIRESHILFKENQPKLIHNSIDQGIKLTLNSKDIFCNTLLKIMKSHYLLIYWDYSQMESLMTETTASITKMNQDFDYFKKQISSPNPPSVTYPEFFQTIINSNKQNQMKRVDLQIRDVLSSFEMVTTNILLNNNTGSLTLIIGEFKRVGKLLENFEMYIKDLIDIINIDITPITPVFTFGPSSGSSAAGGITHLLVLSYLMFGIHDRTIGELSQSQFYLSNALHLIDKHIVTLYNNDNGEVAQDHMAEVRSLIRLKFMVHENLFYIKVTTFELDDAFTEIENCNYLLNQYPLLFSDFGDTVVHTLSSIYLQSIGNHDQSKQHITIALNKSTRFDIQILSIIRMVIHTLYIGQIDTARKLISDYLLQMENHPQLVLKVVTLFLDGIVNVSITPNESKKKFKECLNLLENKFTHNQMASNILLSLLKLYSQYPSNDEKNLNMSMMLETAVILLTVSNDLVGLCCCYDGSPKSECTKNLESMKVKRNIKISTAQSKKDQLSFFQSLLSKTTQVTSPSK